MQPLGYQRMGDPEHHGHIRPGTGGHPFGRDLGQIVLQRAERNEPHAVVGGGVQIRAHLMRGHAAGADEGVLDRQTAERNHQLGLIDDLPPVGGELKGIDCPSQHAPQDRCGRPQAIGIDRGGIAPEQIQKTPQVALGVMEPPCARPAVGAAVDRRGSMGRDDAVELHRQQIERPVPFDFHERIDAAFVGRAGTVFQPALANCRALDPRRRRRRTGDIAQQRRRIVVERMRHDLYDFVVGNLCQICAPMGELRDSARHARSRLRFPDASTTSQIIDKFILISHFSVGRIVWVVRSVDPREATRRRTR